MSHLLSLTLQLLSSTPLGIFQPLDVPFILAPSEFPSWVQILVLTLTGCLTLGRSQLTLITGDSEDRKIQCMSNGQHSAWHWGHAQ